MKPASRRLAGSALYFICLLLLLNLTTPALYRLVPNDYSRTRTLLDVARSPGFRPHTVVFGDSRAMTGINANVLRSRLGDTEIYHFGSVGQPLGESALYYPLLPASTRTVIQCLNPQQLFASAPPRLARSRITAFNMYRHSIAGDADTLFGPLLKADQQPALLRNHTARGFLVAGATIWLKEQLDDVVFRDSLASTTYPYLYPTDRSPSYTRELAYYDRETVIDTEAPLNDELVALLNRLGGYLTARDIRYYLVLMPLSSDLHAGDRLRNLPVANRLRERLSKEIRLIDAVQQLAPDAFYDGAHPNRRGAEILSNLIADSLLSNNHGSENAVLLVPRKSHD